MSISGQIVSEIVAQLCLENSIQTLLNFLGPPRKKLEEYNNSISSTNRTPATRPSDIVWGIQREDSSKPLKHSIVKRILVFRR